MRRSETDEARPPVSCYICPIDEETRIEATVQAALRVAREVVVVASGSTDRTVVMARAAGARVIERKRSDPRDRTRAGEDACRRDWLLYLDSGEIVTEELAREMHDLFHAGEPSADAFRLPVHCVDPAGRIWKNSRPRRSVKLYDRRKVRLPVYGAEDQFHVPQGLRVRRLRGPVLDHAFEDIGHLSRKQRDHAIRQARVMDPNPPWLIALKVYLGLPCFFLCSYVVRGRWLEGRYGFLFAVVASYYRWYRYAILYRRRLRRLRKQRTGTSKSAVSRN